MSHIMTLSHNCKLIRTIHEETHVISRARFDEIALFSNIPCSEKCDALFSEAGIGYITALDIRKLKQLLYEVSRGLYFISLRSTGYPRPLQVMRGYWRC
jgi:hypothetical protein